MKLNDFTDSVSDVLMPSQYADMHRATERDGEHKLFLAILEDAIACYLGQKGFNDGGQRAVTAIIKQRRHEDAMHWLGLCDGPCRCAADGPAPVTFQAICDLFGFVADDIRKALLTRGREIKFQRHMHINAPRTKVRPNQRNRDRERHERRARAMGELRRAYTRAEDAPMWDGVDSVQGEAVELRLVPETAEADHE